MRVLVDRESLILIHQTHQKAQKRLGVVGVSRRLWQVRRTSSTSARRHIFCRASPRPSPLVPKRALLIGSPLARRGWVGLKHKCGICLPFDTSALPHLVVFCAGERPACVWFWGHVYEGS